MEKKIENDFFLLTGMSTSSRGIEKSIFSRTDFAECPDEGRKEKCKGDGNPQDDVKVEHILKRNCGIDRVIIRIENELKLRNSSDMTVSRDLMGLIFRIINVIGLDWEVAKEDDLARNAIVE